MAAVQTFVDASASARDTEVDPDAFQAAMEAMDRGTLRLAEVNIAKTLRASS